jgi:hypothetical protein
MSHPAGDAALTALNAALLGAAKPDKAIGQRLADALSAALASYATAVTIYNDRSSDVSLAVTAATRCADAVQAIAGFIEPDVSGLGGVDAALVRLAAAQRRFPVSPAVAATFASAIGSTPALPPTSPIGDAIAGVTAALRAAMQPPLPSDASVVDRAQLATKFTKYLVAA